MGGFDTSRRLNLNAESPHNALHTWRRGVVYHRCGALYYSLLFNTLSTARYNSLLLSTSYDSIYCSLRLSRPTLHLSAATLLVSKEYIPVLDDVSPWSERNGSVIPWTPSMHISPTPQHRLTLYQPNQADFLTPIDFLRVCTEYHRGLRGSINLLVRYDLLVAYPASTSSAVWVDWNPPNPPDSFIIISSCCPPVNIHSHDIPH